MRWLRRGPVQQSPGHQEALLDRLRSEFGDHVPGAFTGQARAAARALDGDDGLAVAARVLHEFTGAAHADLLGQAGELHRRYGSGPVVDRRNYRALWRAAGSQLRWRLFEFPFHPYVHVAAAASVVGERAKRCQRVTDPRHLVAAVFETLDLLLAGWEFGRVRVDADGVALTTALIEAGRALNAALDEPPPLPPPIREWMRRNISVTVHDPAGPRVLGQFDPGRAMRESLLV